MTAPMPWSEVMAPLPVILAYGDTAPTSVQQPNLTDLFASLLETCLKAAPVSPFGDPRPLTDIRQPAATLAGLVSVEAEDDPVPQTPTQEPSGRQAELVPPVATMLSFVPPQASNAPPVVWVGTIAPTPGVETPLYETTEMAEENLRPLGLAPASMPSIPDCAEPAVEIVPAPERSVRGEIAIVPPPAPPSQLIIGKPVRTQPDTGVAAAPGNAFRTGPPPATRSLAELAFAARLTDRSFEQGQSQLLAVLAAPESEVRLAETAFGGQPEAPQGPQCPAQSGTDAPALDDRTSEPAKVGRAAVPLPAATVASANRSAGVRNSEPAGLQLVETGVTTRPSRQTDHLPSAGQAVPPVRERTQGPRSNTPVWEGSSSRQPEAILPADPDAQDQPARKAEGRSVAIPVQPRSAAADRRPSLSESPAEVQAFPRPALQVGPPTAVAEHRSTPLAPYRAPEFVATQPGVRTPWSTSADLPASPIEPRAKPVHEFSLAVSPRVGDTRAHEQVQVRVVERAGEIKVAVHTPDTELAQSLKEQLGDLVQRLERTGYHTEIWQPGEPQRLAGLRQSDVGGESDTTGGRQGDQQGPPHHQSRQHRHQQQDRPRWFETLEAAGLGDVSSRPDHRSTHDLSH